MIAGLLLAVRCALAGSVSVLLKQRGAGGSRAPSRAQRDRLVWLEVVDGGLAGRARRVAVARWCAVAGVAVDRAAVISGGLVFLAILAERFFGFQLGLGNGPACWSRRSGWPCWG
jgi:hypothetical protein